MQNTPDCKRVLEDPSILQDMAKNAIKDWIRLQKGKDKMTSAMKAASEQWKSAMDICHPGALANNGGGLSLRAFTDGFGRCGDPGKIQLGGNPDLFGGEWCISDWRNYLRPAFESYYSHWGPWSGHSALENRWIQTARCALHLEFPFAPQSITKTPSIATATDKRSQLWRPKRVLVLALTLGSTGATMGCKLVSTAVPRGWEVALVEGSYIFRGYKYKYTYTLKGLKAVLDSSKIPANETLVVFADAKDMLVQQPPEAIVDAFLRQPHDFVWSSEPKCFPMGVWPYSLGVPFDTCGNGMFPQSSQNGIQPSRRFVNAGGWVSIGSTAIVVLKELVNLVQNRPKDAVCHSWGSDQLSANAAYLRHSNVLGLDTDYEMFGSDAWSLIDSDLKLQTLVHEDAKDSNSQSNKAYCQESSHTCPGMLHFNGVGSEGGLLQQAFEVLTTSKSLQSCRPGGKFSVVNTITGNIRTDSSSDSSWFSCFKGNACLGR